MQRTENDLQHNVKGLEIVAAILRESLKADSLNVLLDRTLTLILSRDTLVLEKKGAIFLTDAGSLVMASQQGMEPALQEHSHHVAMSHCLHDQMERLVYVADLDTYHELLPSEMKAQGHYCLPLQTEDELLGILTLYLPPHHHQEWIEEHFMIMVADTLALIIRHARAAEALRHARDDLKRLVALRTVEL